MRKRVKLGSAGIFSARESFLVTLASEGCRLRIGLTLIRQTPCDHATLHSFEHVCLINPEDLHLGIQANSGAMCAVRPAGAGSLAWRATV